MDAVALLTGRGGLRFRGLILTTLLVLLASLGDRAPLVQAQSAPVGANFVLDAGDLRFIFGQIEISQAHSAAFTPANQCATLFEQIGEFRLPFGLRTVDGSCNHLEPGSNEFGASDNVFPRMTGPRPVFIRRSGGSARLRADERNRRRPPAAHHQQPDRGPDDEQPGGCRGCGRPRRIRR